MKAVFNFILVLFFQLVLAYHLLRRQKGAYHLMIGMMYLLQWWSVVMTAINQQGSYTVIVITQNYTCNNINTYIRTPVAVATGVRMYTVHIIQLNLNWLDTRIAYTWHNTLFISLTCMHVCACNTNDVKVSYCKVKAHIPYLGVCLLPIIIGNSYQCDKLTLIP